MPYLDELRAMGGEVKLVWAACGDFKVGPVPDGWADAFNEPPPSPAPVAAYRGNKGAK
jgi:hypothetical protein